MCRKFEGKSLTCKDLNYDILLLKLIVVSVVSSFEAFLETVCKTVLIKNHNLFRKFDSILSRKQIPKSGDASADWDQLADALIEKLSYKSLRTSTLQNIGVVLPKKKSGTWISLDEIIERRNVIVHNGGKPDARYRRIIPSPPTYKSGGLVIDIEYVRAMCELLSNISKDIVKQLVENTNLDKSELI